MNDKQNDQNEDISDDAFAELLRALLVRLDAFMDEQDIGEFDLADLLLDAAIQLRMSAYASDIDKPSVAGLKLDLDRLQVDVEQMIRDAKRDADSFIAEVKEEKAEASREPEGG